MYSYGYDVNAEVIAVGKVEGKRARLIAKIIDYSGDMMPDGDGYVPQMFISFDHGRFDLAHGLNLHYFPVDEDYMVNVIDEMRWRFRDNWEEMTERWLRIMGAHEATVQQISLNQSSWGILIAAYGDSWRDMTGVPGTYNISDMDTREFVNWLQGDVSEVYVEYADDDCECYNCESHRALERGETLSIVAQPIGGNYLGNDDCSLVWVADTDWISSIVYADPFDIMTDRHEDYRYLREEFEGECDTDTYENV